MKILNVAKAALYGIYLNYYCYYVLNGAFIPRGTMIFFAVAFLCVGLDVISERYIYIGTEFKSWILYTVLSFISTGFILLGSGSSAYISDIIKYAQRLIMTMMIAYICEREDSIRFGLQLMAVTAVACAVSIIMVTGDIQLKLNITSGADLSANDIGAIMAFGCFAVTYAWGKRGHASLLLSSVKVTGFICCMVVIFLAGSRKSIFAVLIMAAVLLVLCLPEYRRSLHLRKAASVLLVGTVAYWFVTENLLPYAEQTNLYTRLLGRGAEGTAGSDRDRILLIRYALEDFAAHPFFGLGFNQYDAHHGNYTHCTYVEPLACSGMLGLLYLYPYVSMVQKQLYLIQRSKRGSRARVKQKELLAYLAMFLFVGVGIPFMYKDIPCIPLGTFIASQAISFRELREKGTLSENY